MTRSWAGLAIFLGLMATVSAQQPASLTSWPEGRRAALSLTFDDALPSQVQIGTALLKRLGVKATFYVVPSNVEQQLEGWRTVVANGHEIGNHTLNHPCSGNFGWSRAKALEDFTLERMRLEMGEANRRISELLGVTPVSFAYPCGQTFVGRGIGTRSYVPIAAGWFQSARGWRDEVANDLRFLDLAQLTGIESDDKDFQQILPMIEAAKASGQWLVLVGHDIGQEGPHTTRVAMLEQLARYAADPANGVWIAPVGTVTRHLTGKHGR